MISSSLKLLIKRKKSYVGDSSREFMDRAREEILKKILDLDSSSPIDPKVQAEIERDVMRELMGPDKPGRARGYQTGVTKSQVTKFSFDLRKRRSEDLTNQNRVLLDKVESQSKEIESQSKQIESQSRQMKIMEQRIDEFTGELQVFKTAFQDLYNARTSKDTFFTTPHVACENRFGTQVFSSDALFEDCE